MFTNNHKIVYTVQQDTKQLCRYLSIKTLYKYVLQYPAFCDLIHFSLHSSQFRVFGVNNKNSNIHCKCRSNTDIWGWNHFYSSHHMHLTIKETITQDSALINKNIPKNTFVVCISRLTLMYNGQTDHWEMTFVGQTTKVEYTISVITDLIKIPTDTCLCWSAKQS